MSSECITCVTGLESKESNFPQRCGKLHVGFFLLMLSHFWHLLGFLFLHCSLFFCQSFGSSLLLPPRPPPPPPPPSFFVFEDEEEAQERGGV